MTAPQICVGSLSLLVFILLYLVIKFEGRIAELENAFIVHMKDNKDDLEKLFENQKSLLTQIKKLQHDYGKKKNRY